VTAARAALGIAALILSSACESSSTPAKATSARASSRVAAAGKVELLPAPPGESVETIMTRELARAEKDHSRVLVYVSASWCEPCKYFHDAAARGELDAQFPGLRLVEFDLDRDRARLSTAGCASSMIPLFALPQADGTCSPTKRLFGAAKGERAVESITPRLAKLLR